MPVAFFVLPLQSLHLTPTKLENLERKEVDPAWQLVQ